MPESPADLRPIAVIGGGISGLSAAWELTRNGRRVELFERSEKFGGKIDQIDMDGLLLPTGPDAFLARRTEVSSLATEIGLGDSLTSPVARSARIYRDGVLHPLPPNVLGVPATADLSSSGLISTEGAARAAQGPSDDAGRVDTDESVGALVRRQLGDEVLEFLVDPLLGGINAGDSDRLSVEAGVPQLDALRKRGPRLLDAAADTLTAAAAARGSDPAPPVFYSVQGGLSRLVERLVDLLKADPLCNLHTGASPRPVRAGDGWLVGDLDVSDVITTIPAHGSAEFVEEISPVAGDLLRGIEYSSVALTIMTLAPGTIDLDPTVSGVLVPRMLGHNVTAVSFASHKWPDLAVRDRQVLRVSVGRRTDTRWMSMTNDELVSAIEDDLSEIFGVEIASSNTHVTRWMHALPQYDVGHRERIAQLDRTLDELRGLHMTGAWRDGLGLPACVAAGRHAARAAIGSN